MHCFGWDRRSLCEAALGRFDRIVRGFGTADWQRVKRLSKMVDPRNVFLTSSDVENARRVLSRPDERSALFRRRLANPWAVETSDVFSYQR
jgi:hypothetical protein